MEATNTSRASVRAIVRGAYDLQKLRIETGNRLVANLKVRLGQEPGKSEDTLDEPAKAMLASLRAAYDRITDGAKSFPKHKSFKGDELITTYTELVLVAQYFELLKQEGQHFRRLEKVLLDYPVYTEFLEGIAGIGPAMAGVIVSEIDISAARYPSSLWAYAGLDVLHGWTLVDVQYVSGDRAAAEAYVEGDNIPETRPLVGLDRSRVTFDAAGPSISVVHPEPQFSVIAIYRYDNGEGRSRRKEHLREVSYVDKDGNPATRVGITFNPFLKTKLVGVLGPSFLKIGPEKSPYAAVYYDYKNRLENHERYGVANDGQRDDNDRIVTSKGKRHNMAVRYMVKRFLVDLYKAWRAIEGLPVAPEYSQGKLGIEHVA